MHACTHARATPRPAPAADEIRESDIGTGAGLFEVRKIGDEFYTFIVDCKVGGRAGEGYVMGYGINYATKWIMASIMQR